MEKVPALRQRIAGKSIPLEVRRSFRCGRTHTLAPRTFAFSYSAFPAHSPSRMLFASPPRTELRADAGPQKFVARKACKYLAVHPLNASGLCSSARVPFGSPSLSLRTSIRVLLIASDFSTNGFTVESIRA